MRVPVPLVVLLVAVVVGGVWWSETRHLDFMTPPPEAELQKIRRMVEAALPRAESSGDAISAPVVIPAPEPPLAPIIEAKPTIDVGNLRAPLALQNYGELSPKGADYLIGLAMALESQNEFRRGLLAWERVLDLSKPNEEQRATAVSAIQRLRASIPEWNSKPETATKLILHVSTGKKLSKPIATILESVAHDLERASSGIVKIKTSIVIGKSNSKDKSPAPVAVWLTGPDRHSSTTGVLSFTADSVATLRADLFKTVYSLIQSHLSRNTAYSPPADLTIDEDPQAALSFRITRLGWSEFAAAMNLPAEKPMKP